MKPSHQPRPRYAVVALAALLAGLLALPLLIDLAWADTLFPPTTGAFEATVDTNSTTYTYAPDGSPPTSHGPTISTVTNGQAMTVAIDGNSPPNDTESAFSRLRVKQCKGGTTVNNIADFDPFTTNKCTSAPLGAGDDFKDSGPLAPGTKSASVSFKAGIGTAPDTISGFDGSTLPGFTCDSTHPCQLVLNVQVTSGSGSNNFLSFPIQFAGAATAPGAPGTPTATAGNAQATVAWVAPGSNGGSAITNYTVTSTPGNKTCSKASAPLLCTVSGLTNGVAYTFKVVATNGIGDGPASAASNSVTPAVPPAGDLFTGITPKRLLDSRPGFQVGPFNTPWAAGAQRDVTVAGGATTVPADADAVTLNVTVTQTNAVSYLTLWPKGDVKPTASSLNWNPGWTVPNSVTVKVGAGGQISVFNNLGNAHVVIDVVGYYKAGTGAGFSSVQPKRLLDSRSAFQVGPFDTPWGATTDRLVTVAGGTTTVPADADSVVLNVTVTQTDAVSYLSVWPNGQSQPTVSSLNWDAGWTIPNAATVKVGTGGQIHLYNNAGVANVIVDVVGYFKAGTGVAFHPQSPTRILDSRPSFQVGPFSTPWGAGASRNLDVTSGAVSDSADSVLLNVTVTQTNAVSFLSVWPNGQVQPTVSSLNWISGWTIPNAVTAKVGTNGQIRIFNNLGSVDVIADVAGWYG